MIIDSSKTVTATTNKATTTTTTTTTTTPTTTTTTTTKIITTRMTTKATDTISKSGIRSMWHLPKEKANCWSGCKRRGGNCEWCGQNGYCCSGTKHHLNGDCPSDGVTYIGTQTSRKSHLCVANLNGEY